MCFVLTRLFFELKLMLNLYSKLSLMQQFTSLYILQSGLLHKHQWVLQFLQYF